MKFLIVFIGKTDEKYLVEGINNYLKRLSHYMTNEVNVFPVSSLKDKRKAMEEEGSKIYSKLLPGDFVVVLDERGIEFSSRQLSSLIQKWMTQSIGRVVFIVGGPYGISDAIKKRANLVWSLSQLTFTHQMIRLLLAEQLYRAMTIVKNEGYHHD